jgi:hypothetical protein
MGLAIRRARYKVPFDKRKKIHKKQAKAQSAEVRGGRELELLRGAIGAAFAFDEADTALRPTGP